MTQAISPSRTARTVGVGAFFKNLRQGGFALPMRIPVFAQGSTASTFSTDRRQVFSAQEAGETYGFGSPIHLIVEQLLPANGDGVGDIPVTIYPLDDGTTAADFTITPVGTATADGTYFVKVNNIVSASFEIPDTTTAAAAAVLVDAAINAAIKLPVTSSEAAGVVTAVAKWQGTTGNDLIISVEGPSAGLTFGVAAGTVGAGDPLVDTPLTKIGTTWETMGINALGPVTAALDAFSSYGESRWAAEVSKPLVMFYGETESSVATAITVPDARGTDRTNSQLVSPGSDDLPFVVAARQVARIAVRANSASPASDYAGLLATGLTPGAEADQWESAERQTAFNGGSSTIELIDGVVTLSDTISMYAPAGDDTPAYRYVVDQVKLWNMLHDLRTKFSSNEWKGVPLVPEDQFVTDRRARKPSTAAAEVEALVDDWAARALISDPATAKESIVAAISSVNPKRLDISVTVQLSGNANVISADLNFGFFFGGN